MKKKEAGSLEKPASILTIRLGGSTLEVSRPSFGYVAGWLAYPSKLYL